MTPWLHSTLYDTLAPCKTLCSLSVDRRFTLKALRLLLKMFIMPGRKLDVIQIFMSCRYNRCPEVWITTFILQTYKHSFITSPCISTIFEKRKIQDLGGHCTVLEMISTVSSISIWASCPLCCWNTLPLWHFVYKALLYKLPFYLTLLLKYEHLSCLTRSQDWLTLASPFNPYFTR